VGGVLPAFSTLRHMNHSSRLALAPQPTPMAPEQAPLTPAEAELVALVADAAAGETRAWDALVHRYDSKLRAVARSYRLSASDVDDVVQMAWIKLFEHIRTIRNPAALPGWLKTTVRRNALATLQRPVRELLSDDPDLGDGADVDGPEALLLAAEQREALLDALRILPERHRAMMMAFATEPSIEYSEISEQLEIPRGSIGPIRARSLSRLAQHPRLAALRV
jgi:RNA polymerase sigma factor (sigma-70 family)